MARSVRQSKILELISVKEIETQDELVECLRSANFDITQATISRDIKELGLIKILSAETGKYKYSLVDSGEQAVSNKYISIFKEAVISIKTAQNLVVLKTIRATAGTICSLIDKLNLDSVLGAVAGDDTVMIILPNNDLAEKVAKTIENIMHSA
ncbi:MAG: arginine repressor [Firmicutes bacterium]|nr:arginine repressor [Bacillota bacterium]MDY3658827.1 arginine repressor [Eubacteriales bacterium]